MPDSVYKVIELIGTSTKSWEDAAKNAVERASQSLRDLRVAEVIELDMQLDNGKVEAYRAKVNVSFKYEGGASALGSRRHQHGTGIQPFGFRCRVSPLLMRMRISRRMTG